MTATQTAQELAAVFPTAAEDPMTDQWWRDAVVYQIYPRSFADSNGDGVGDLPGITSRLPALADLGVDAVWLSPFFTSPLADAGYDVADHCDVDPVFGTLADFDALAARARELDLKLVVDLVPNHSSDQHVWFAEALASPPGSRARGRYLFRDGTGPGGDAPPNNWRSVFGGGAWERITEADGSPGQWYLHLFDVSQPDFDWTNPEVHEEFRRVLRFWLDRGVAGFRVDVAHGLVKADGLPDEDGTSRIAVMAGGSEDDASAGTGMGPFWDQDGVHEIYRDWHKVVDSYPGDPMMVAEAWVSPLARLARYVRADEMQQAFNFEFLSAPFGAPELRRVIDASLDVNASVGAPTTWVLSNHDVVRHASRMGLRDLTHRPNGIGIGDEQPDAELGLRRARAATALMLALPGSAYLYQGEELGLPEHTTLPDELRQDPTWERHQHTERGRDGCRIPIPWEADAPGLGFGPTDATWLPQPGAYAALARDRQDGVPGSTLELYKSALATRREYGLGRGAVEWSDAPEGVLSFRNGDLVVMTNTGSTPVAVTAGRVVLASCNDVTPGALPGNATVWLRPVD